MTGTGAPAPTPNLSAAPTTLSFGNVTVGTKSAAQAIVLRNAGGAAATGIAFASSNAARFRLSANTCGATLNPGASTFSYSVKMQSSHVPASGTDYDIMRKGLGTTTGGEYKIEIVRVNGQGRAFCLVKDSRGVGASVKGTTNVTDGKVHTLTCVKTASGLTLKVDALTPRTKTVAGGLGSISNTTALVIGAKSRTVTGTAGDWYDGALLEARISVG